jgi:hypothetical protein
MVVKLEGKVFFNPLRQRNRLLEVHPRISEHVKQGANARMELDVVKFMTELRTSSHLQ